MQEKLYKTQEYSRNSWLKRKYNLTQDDYNLMLFKQKGCCAICNTHQSELSKTLHVDHCHTTGKVRGLLCYNCNLGIGKFKDDINNLKSAIKYLRVSNIITQYLLS